MRYSSLEGGIIDSMVGGRRSRGGGMEGRRGGGEFFQ